MTFNLKLHISIHSFIYIFLSIHGESVGEFSKSSTREPLSKSAVFSSFKHPCHAKGATKQWKFSVENVIKMGP